MRIPRLLLLMILVMGTKPAGADVSIWFEDARHSPALSDDAIKAVAAHIRHRMLTPDQPGQAPFLPRSVRDDFYPRVLFISASDGIKPARVATGTSRGILKAADHAIAQLKPGEKDAFEPRWLKVDHPATIILQENADLNVKLEYERSLFGIAFPRQTRLALLSEELIGNDIVNHHQGFFIDQLLAYLDVRKPAVDRKNLNITAENATFFRFSSQSFFMDRQEIVPLYRGHRRHHRITRQELGDSAAAAAKYLKESVNRYGQFAYLYKPNVDSVPDEYNMLRHFGTILSMADAYEILKDPDLLEAARRAMDFADNTIGQWTIDGLRVPAVVEEGRVKLGGNALAAGALARLGQVSNDEKMIARARTFAKALALAQRGDGSFVQIQRFPDGHDYNIEHPYYPGEAIFALSLVQQVAPDPLWVSTADKAAQHLILVRDKGLPIAQLTQDHWLLYGLNDLYRQWPRELYLEHAARITRAMCRSQHRRPPFVDWHGGYYAPPGSTPTAVRTEGLIAAYALLRDHGGEAYRDDAAAALEAGILGAAFQLQCQFRPESAMYFKNPQRILGAFRDSLTSPYIRIDFVQHNMMGLLNLRRVMEKEKIESFAVPPMAQEKDAEDAGRSAENERTDD